MNVPSQQTPPYGQPPAPAAGSKVPRYVLFGCAGIVLLLVVGGIIASLILRSVAMQMLGTFTSDEPLTVAEVRMSASELFALERRIKDFADGLSDGSSTEPLVLTSDEINGLLQEHLKDVNAPVAAEVRILGRQLEGEVSIPLEGRGWPIAGRYLNGKAVFSLGVVDGRVAAYIKDLRVGDRYIPDAVREELSKEDLLDDIYKEKSDLSRALSRIRSIEIDGGKVILSPAR